MSADVAPQSHDIVLKYLAQLFVGQSLSALGLDTPPAVSAAPTELPEVSVRAHALDFLLLLADGSFLHLEFQSTTEPSDLARFLVYDALLYQRDSRRIRTAVIYTGGVKRAPDRVDAGSLRFRVENVYVGGIDGDGRLARLKERAATTGLDADDAVDVALLILMGHQTRTPYEVAREVVGLIGALPGDTGARCEAAVIGLAERYLTDAQFEALLEARQVAKRVSEMIAEGEARGEARGKAEDVLLVLQERFGNVPEALALEIRGQQDVETLGRWMLAALRAGSLADFKRETVL